MMIKIFERENSNKKGIYLVFSLENFYFNNYSIERRIRFFL